jgi:signal transduction histidine kinase
MDTGGLFVFADPLLGRVFYTLMDNTIRHGRNASLIRISTMPAASGISLVYEDNGIGVPDPEKEAIFEQGFGTNTGYGLFIAREILAITGMKIRECGIFSRGARFEISIPDGVYRKK